ncbi:SEC-C domain-containing protein [Leisingera sp. HS039]|uniref:SEC-C metal-binding domain-containing protein n=1 Tax=unclassified Leisingera TaxID=2614906 RepID=UPI00107083CC|nr:MULTISPECIES: SEC-C metal-binding domain-containing protein [unclassified Leisingera]MBQ4825527.1 SEC-C domain-containing protein [Leisingera sp. HS039]QBR35091.1 hypothetical protein ETW23_01860 [Leisingera sp. NJS201]
MENKHGLPRQIDADTCRTIRQEAGFGCVICGHAICDYEHIDPVYSEAKSHDAGRMTLLCKRCHGNVTSKLWSKEKVWEHKSKPACHRDGFSHGIFDFSGEMPIVKLGPVTAKNCDYILTIKNEPVLWFNPPEENGGPIRLNADFRNSGGKSILKIEDNEWRSDAENWDVEQTCNALIFRNGPGSVALKLRVVPRSKIIVESMDLSSFGYRLTCDGKDLGITNPDGYHQHAAGQKINDCVVALGVGDDRVAYDPAVPLARGQGAALSLAGIDYGRGMKPGSVVESGRINVGAPVSPKIKRTQTLAAKVGRKLGRNAACPCGSGQKFKRCCGQ